MCWLILIKKSSEGHTLFVPTLKLLIYDHGPWVFKRGMASFYNLEAKEIVKAHFLNSALEWSSESTCGGLNVNFVSVGTNESYFTFTEIADISQLFKGTFYSCVSYT